MLVVFMCIMMKILDVTVGPVKPRVRNHRPPRRLLRGLQAGLPLRGMPEDISASPDSTADLNSNHTTALEPGKHGDISRSFASNTSSQDLDFVQDNSDYQWFLDYGYRDGSTSTSQPSHHISVLSCCNDVDTDYEDMARNIDANLAEVDMEDFRTEDIHSILSTLPTMCCGDLQSEHHGEMFASVSGSLMAKFEFDSSISPHSSSQAEDDTVGSTDTMSICKSEQLFSPVRECPLPSCNFSVDSLDCEGLTEHDIMLTCQANKDNYTIAFEGSLALCSETDSDYHEPGESDVGTSTESHHRWRHRHISRPGLDTSMARSDSVYTTWSKLKKRSSDVTLSRHPSGNNNTTPKIPTTPAALKSRSLPDLCPGKCVRLYDMGNLSLLRLFMRQRGSCSQSDSAGGASSQGSSHRHCSLDDCSTCVTTTNNNYNNRLSGSDNGNTTTTTTVRQQRLDNWIRADDTAEDYSTCCFEDSLVEPPQKELMQGYQPELIQEETEEEETSESVEQLSESVSKIEESIVLDTSGSSCYGSKVRLARFNLNNNNSVEEPKPSQGTQTNCPVNRSIGIFASPVLSTKAVQTAAERRRCYLLFPNYTLPDLTFLGEKRRDIELLLAPQKLKVRHGVGRRPRPLSCDDVEALRRKGFSHVKDRDSLAVLLPKEYRRLLEPETKISTSTTSSTATQPSSGFRGSSTLLTDSNPLLVYRYDSETSSCHQPALPKRSVSLPTGAPPRPPLPRSILRRGHESGHGHRKPPPPCLDPDKERDECEDDDEGVDAGTDSSYEEPISRMRPPTPPLPRKQDDCELLRLEELLHVSGLSSVLTSGEGIDTWDEADMKRLRQQVSKFLAGQRSESQSTPHNTPEHRMCDCSSSSGRSSRKTVSFRLNLPTPPNSPSNNGHHQNKMTTEGIGMDKEQVTSGRSNQSSEKKLSPVMGHSPLTHVSLVDISQKRELVTAVGDAVEQVVSHFAAAENRQHCCLLGDSVHTPAIARLTLGKLCPALYAALSDGLKSELDTAFGPIPNSLWQVVEASAQQGPMTKALNELVLRINSEDVFTEGLMKFNAFVFGLLNVRSLDAWAGYLRTRESVLRRHYHEDTGLLPLGNLGGPGWRGLADQLVACLQPLALLPFRLDFLYQPRQLAARLTLSPPAQQQQKQWSLRGLVRSIHSSLSVSTSEDSKDSPLPDIVGSSKVWDGERTPRPRSCVDTPAAPGNAHGTSLVTDLASTVRKRWSGIQLGSRLFQAFDRLAAEDEGCSLGEYPDSLEQQATNTTGATAAEQSQGSTGQAGGKFRRLQMKWELLSNKEPPSNGPSPKSSPDSNLSSVSSNAGKSSRIPRPVTSPNRASGIPVLSPGVPRSTGTISRRSVSAIPMRKQSPAPVRSNVSSEKTRKVPVGTTSRPSRLDQVENKSSANRPSSLPYRQPSAATGRASQRRPVSASGTGVRTAPTAQRLVRALCHRLPSDAGHLAFNEGDTLRVVLEVDALWLLCCRGDQKGLVPRSAVI